MTLTMRPCPHCGGSGSVPEAFGDRVKEAREAKGMTQAVLAEKVGITRPHIANIETNRSDAGVPLLIGLAGELGVTIDWLLTGKSPQSLATEER